MCYSLRSVDTLRFLKPTSCYTQTSIKQDNVTNAAYSHAYILSLNHESSFKFWINFVLLQAREQCGKKHRSL